MKQITTISGNASQQIFVSLDDGSIVSMRLNYRPAIQRWVFGYDYGTHSDDGIILSVHPNILRAGRNVLPFGLACASTDGADPALIDDFKTGHTSLFVLTADEVLQVESDFFMVAS